MIPFLDIHTHKAKQEAGTIAIQSLSVSERVFLAMPKTKPISVGIHPWHSKADEFDRNLKYLNVLAKQNNVKLIGECGLDKLQGEDLSFQTEVFAAQVKLAENLQKPIIIHCVRAFDELIAIKKKLNPTVPMIVHGFNKKPELAQQLMHQGFYLSFGEAVLNNPSLAKLIGDITSPFFLETDDSQIDIKDVYSKIAEMRKISVEELKDIIFANWKFLGLCI